MGALQAKQESAVTERPLRAWLVTQARDSKYSNVEGRAYEYPQRIQYGRQIAVGDALIALLPPRDAADGRRIVGMGRIGTISEGENERLVATYDRYLRLAVPATFEELGGDPRRNRTISINPLGDDFVQRLRQGRGSRVWMRYRRSRTICRRSWPRPPRPQTTTCASCCTTLL